MNVAKTRTFVDADVLINAFRGAGSVATAAQEVLDDPAREFVASDILRLELIPKSRFFGRIAEAQFYEAFFASVVQFMETTPAMVKEAENEAKTIGLSAADALHVSAAKIAGAHEFITAEKRTSGLFRTSGLVVKTLRR